MNHRAKRIRLRVSGIVQGVGFRPFVWKRARQFGLTGWVQNDSPGVTLEIQGDESQLAGFVLNFRDAIPPLADIHSLDVTEIEAVFESTFSIRESQMAATQSTPISPEISICFDCLRELNDPRDRRYRYPFINCTNCGPRFTIVTDIPYDRPATTMNSFRMCNECQREYDDPADRRFHAQPNACPACGPGVWLVESSASEERFTLRPESEANGHLAIQGFQNAIEAGLIVAVKGIGGFHLACDASNTTTIARLRERKGRVDKPFALMVRDVALAKSFASVTESEQSFLESKERPIVLLPKKNEPLSSANVCLAAVAPGNNFVGVMLPYSPLHYLLVGDIPLVLTSGNITDEPIVRTNAEAHQRLRKIADCFLLHDREINVVCDDSVVRCVDGALLPIRRSRGYTPMPVKLADSGPSVLAVGGEIKSTFCVTKHDYAYISQHIGDMGNLETLDAMRRSVEHFLRLFRVEVEAVAADLHPDYLSGQWANEFAGSIGVPLFRVQHHFAHVASLLAEHELPADHKIIGCCFDGTGFGTDEAIWGGEFMVADTRTFDRFAHLKYTPLPGGDSSIRRPYRVALAQLWAAGLPWDDDLPCVATCPSGERKLLQQQLERNLNCISTSSMGRLFDAVASMIGVRHNVNYEAQAAMEMESLAANVVEEVDALVYRFLIEDSSQARAVINHGSMLRQICADVLSGVERSHIATQFHHAVANMVVEVSQLARKKYALRTVGLTGGVFQNVLLLRLTLQRLREEGFEVLTHATVPPNDGGIALGQAIVASRTVRDQ